jgi:hypothetical protein
MSHASGRILAIVLLLVVAALAAPAAGGEEPLLRNGTLKAWKDGKPVGWDVSIGAKNREGPPSTLRARPGGGLALEGGATTGTWRYVSQRVALEPGDFARLDFEAGVEGRRRDPGQYQSCYVGLVYKDARGRRLGMAIHALHGGVEPGTVFVRVPLAAAHVEVAIFLSMTGVLEVRSVSLRRLGVDDSYSVLTEDMDRHYSFFAAHEIDWDALCRKHLLNAVAAEGAESFVEDVMPLLAALEDPHVFFEMPDGRRIPTVTKQPTPNVNYPVTARSLTDIRQIGRTAFAGRTKRGGYGFLAVASLQQSDGEFERIDEALRGLFDAPALILDLRGNVGGSEFRAQRLASYLAKARTLYARSKIRSGKAHDALVDAGARHVVPHPSIRYGGPVACLVGPVCISSGEGFAMMMKALPNVVVLGQPTRGASGNPQPVHLPNGVTVHYSRWQSFMPDGTMIERRGVPPDIVVKQKGEGDPTLEAAIEELERRVKAR